MRLWEFESLWSFSWDSGLPRAVTNNATSSRPGLLDGHRGRQCRCAQRGLGKGRATRHDGRNRHMVLWPTGQSIGIRMGLQVQVLPGPLLPLAHGCLSGYGVSESLDSVTEPEPRQTQQVSWPSGYGSGPQGQERQAQDLPGSCLAAQLKQPAFLKRYLSIGVL